MADNVNASYCAQLPADYSINMQQQSTAVDIALG